MSGYIGTAPVPQSTQTRETFTATAGQATFNTGGYTAGYIDVFLNGVKLVSGTDYTATNGSDVVLLTGASAGDTLETVAYTAFTVADQTFTGNIVMADGLTVDNDGATVLTVDRATSDGTIIDVQKNGTTVGSISASGTDLVIGTTDVGVKFSDNLSSIYPYHSDGTTGAQDALIDLGYPTARFKNLYLSGGVYLGGTGSANYLDDYEEGTWTPILRGNLTAGTYGGSFTGQYTKTGNIVHIEARLSGITVTSAGTGYIQITGIPFSSGNTTTSSIGACRTDGIDFGLSSYTNVVATFVSSSATTRLYLRAGGSNANGSTINISNLSAGDEIAFQLTYSTS